MGAIISPVISKGIFKRESAKKIQFFVTCAIKVVPIILHVPKLSSSARGLAFFSKVMQKSVT